MDSNFWIALVAQLPIVAAIMIGLNREWIVVGPSFRRLLADQVERVVLLTSLLQDAVTERKEADEKVVVMTTTLRETAEVMKRSVDLNEALLEELRRK